jgi:hypothetical protein
MNRKHVLAVLAIATLSTSLAIRGPLQAAESSAAPAAAQPRLSAESSTNDWRTDPSCQLVFFAVLEGLYTDGVPDEAVDLIVPPKAAGDDGVKRCFVFRCPLCHAAYEAFVLYQHRTAFQGSNEARSTMGKSFDAKILAGLKSEKPQVRVFAMGSLMRPWVERRMKMMNLGAKEQGDLLKKLLDHAAKGDEMFRTYKADVNSVYHEWMFYGGCQACEAATDVARQMRR